MLQKARATLFADWSNGRTDIYHVQFNPKELSFEKSAQYGEINIPGLDAPLQQFVRGQAEKLSIELFFDSTEKGMGDDADSVTEQTDRVFRMVKVDGVSHAPAVVTFVWNEHFPGGNLTFPKVCSNKANEADDSQGGDQGGSQGATQGGNQSRNSFRGVVESVRQQFTLFSNQGVPLRATVNLVLREFRPLETQLSELGLSSPDRTHGHVLSAGDTLSSVAGIYYSQPNSWRAIAAENDVTDPRRIHPGRLLTVPPITD